LKTDGLFYAPPPFYVVAAALACFPAAAVILEVMLSDF
jgi:hypothetical protein